MAAPAGLLGSRVCSVDGLGLPFWNLISAPNLWDLRSYSPSLALSAYKAISPGGGGARGTQQTSTASRCCLAAFGKKKEEYFVIMVSCAASQWQQEAGNQP